MNPKAVPAEWTERLDALSKACVEARLAEGYAGAETQAVRAHAWHRVLTLVGVLAGSTALFLGLVQLAAAYWKPPIAGTSWFAAVVSSIFGVLEQLTHIPPRYEFLLVVAAAIAVAWGSASDHHESWLYWRYRAERFRSLSFRVIVDPRLWTPEHPTPSAWLHHVRAELADIDAVSASGLEDLAAHEEEPEIPNPADCERADPGLLAPLAAHYLEHRLNPQIRYFERQKRSWLDNPVLLPFVFFLSVFFVFVHLAFEEAHGMAEARLNPLSEGFARLSGFMLFVSAAIPIIWTAFRTWRSANEQARNAIRAHAKLNLLRSRARWLEKRLEGGRPDAFRVFTTLALTENLLRNELREWLRLMLEAEWYG